MNYREELIKDILPFWLDNAIDTENGGIFTCLDEKGDIYGEEKSVWFQGRALWCFSRAYTLIERNARYLEAARCIYGFIGKCRDKDGRMFFTVTKEGIGIQKRRYYFSETFAAIGCAEYYRASGDVNALYDAREYFDIAYGCFTGKIYTEPKLNPDAVSAKALSPVMIMLSTAQTMRAADPEYKDKYDRIAGACLDEILNGGFLTEGGLFESVTKDGKLMNTPSGRIINPGHSMEAAWFVMLEGLLSGNKDAIMAGKKIIDITAPLGIDSRHGGIIAFTDACGRPPVQLEWDMKLWWPQCEGIIAAKMAYMLFGEEKYLKLCRELENYCKMCFIDRERGEWYGYLHYDNTVANTAKGNIFKGPFHIPRLYMIMTVLNEGGRIEAIGE